MAALFSAQCCHLLLKLLTNTQLGNYCTITLDILLLQIVQKISSVTNHLQQTTAGVVILLVNLDVFGQFVDPLGEDSDLYFRRTGILLVQTVSLDNCCFFFFS